MRLAFSGLAWDVRDDAAVAALLVDHGIGAVDLVPGKYFPDPAAARPQDLRELRAWWAERGLEITGMQALLFGAAGLNVFGDAGSRAGLLARLGAVCRIGGALGARRLVFGSPRNRDRGDLSDPEALDRAAAFFFQLGDLAHAEGVTICLEPNPPSYGANFMTTTPEAARVVVATDHPAIRLQLDTGAMTILGEAPDAMIRQFAHLAGHVHASEPGLVPLGEGGTDHAAVARALSAAVGPDRPGPDVVSIEMLPGPDVVSIEMLPGPDGTDLAALARAITAAAVYRDVSVQVWP